MKKTLFILTLIVSFIGTEQLYSDEIPPLTEQPIAVVMAGYNFSQWYQRSIGSVLKQKYTNWHLYIIDDGSPDHSADLARDFVTKAGFADHVTIIRNQQRLGSPVANQYKVIVTLDPQDIVVIVDADDWLAHNGVFSYLNKEYTPDLWLTYGQFREWPSGMIGFCSPMPLHVITHNKFREWQHIPSHLRTFRAGLFQKIKPEDLMLDGEFFKMAGDMAAMIPMIEMARNGHFRFIPDVLLEYNAVNPISEHRVSRELQQKVDRIVRSRPRYNALNSLT